MIKTLTKHGNSFALVFDKAIMSLLGINPTTPLKITTDGKSLTIVPTRTEDDVNEQFEKNLKEMNAKYSGMLKKLSQ